jgi:hypothetical protein
VPWTDVEQVDLDRPPAAPHFGLQPGRSAADRGSSLTGTPPPESHTARHTVRPVP